MMKTSFLFTLFGLTFVALTPAQAENKRGRQLPPEVIEQFDTDGDGQLSKEERKAAREARKGQSQRRGQKKCGNCDKDGDGEVSAAEREAAREAMGQRKTERFNDADTNQDGSVSLDEFSATKPMSRLASKRPDAPRQIFQKIDTDQDGAISLEEFLSHQPKGRKGRKGKDANRRKRQRGAQ